MPTLSITCKRSKLSSKSKTISRCERITISRSKNPGAGVGSTTFDDGLTFSSVYGTRVQDESISLNVPDVSRVLAIFESNDNQDPDLPSITVSNGSDTFTNNVVVGEQFIGAESGAIGRVVNVVSGTELTFVYENDRRFELSEQISLSTLNHSNIDNYLAWRIEIFHLVSVLMMVKEKSSAITLESIEMPIRQNRLED